LKPVNDRWVRVSGIGLLLLLDLYSTQTFVQPFGLATLKAVLEFVILTTMTWEVNRWILVLFRKWFPLLSQTKKRILLVLPVCWIATILIDWLDMFVINTTGFHAPYPPASFLNTLPGALIWSVLIVGVQEAVYYFARLLKAEKETEALKKENLQTQLESLKQQVSPHFLFNSLNTLSYLIGDDAKQAEKFLDELSKVYRYLLRNNENELTNLATEMQFIRSYFHLLKTRYGDSLHLQLAIEPRYEAYLLPSLTLQLLLENAVKHNIIHKTQPLTVQIMTKSDGQLTVKNNLQKKTQHMPSTRIGLANIAAKFRLLNQCEIIVEETEHEFAVTIPLMSN
jgi:hypothetical protein